MYLFGCGNNINQEELEEVNENNLNEWSIEYRFGDVEAEHYSIIAKDGILTYDESDE